MKAPCFNFYSRITDHGNEAASEKYHYAREDNDIEREDPKEEHFSLKKCIPYRKNTPRPEKTSDCKNPLHLFLPSGQKGFYFHRYYRA